MSKLSLGTVQFGLDYGISNHRGKIPKKEVFSILDYCWANGIDLLDTAASYGRSEEIIGSYTQHRFKVISKASPDSEEQLHSVIQTTLKNIRQHQLYGYLYHDFPAIRRNISLWHSLSGIKKQYGISKVGVSVYDPQDILWCLQNGIHCDVIQIPYNILDTRCDPYLKQLKKQGVEIYARSVFLQGLLLKKVNDIDPAYAALVPNIQALQTLALDLAIPVTAVCLAFVHLNDTIDRIVIGVDSLENLTENIGYEHHLESVKHYRDTLNALNANDDPMIVPINWN